MLKKGSTVTIWRIDPKEKYTEIQLSTNGKGMDGKWRTDFTCVARCIGTAHGQVRDLKPGKDCKAKVEDFGVTSWIKTTGKGKNEAKQYGYNFIIFAFENNIKAEKNEFSSLSEIDSTFNDIEPGDLPFK